MLHDIVGIRRMDPEGEYKKRYYETLASSRFWQYGTFRYW